MFVHCLARGPLVQNSKMWVTVGTKNVTNEQYGLLDVISGQFTPLGFPRNAEGFTLTMIVDAAKEVVYTMVAVVGTYDSEYILTIDISTGAVVQKSTNNVSSLFDDLSFCLI